MNYFHPYKSKVKYFEDNENTCCFSIFASYLYDARDYVAKWSIVSLLKSCLFCESFGYINMIKFANDIIIDKVRKNVRKFAVTSLFDWGKGWFDIFNYISDHIKLFQTMDNACNVNHAVSITRWWIYHPNYKRALPLMKE